MLPSTPHVGAALHPGRDHLAQPPLETAPGHQAALQPKCKEEQSIRDQGLRPPGGRTGIDAAGQITTPEKIGVKCRNGQPQAVSPEGVQLNASFFHLGAQFVLRQRYFRFRDCCLVKMDYLVP